MTLGSVKLSLEQATALCEQAARAAGASPETALSLARSVVAAEADGQASVGLSHFIDYLEALEAGRIDGAAVPEITRPAPAIILSDAHGGAAHPGFDAAFDDIVEAAQNFGLALFTQRNAFTCGALGYFVGQAGRARPGRDCRHQRPAVACRLRLDEAGLSAPIRWPSPRRSPAARR